MSNAPKASIVIRTYNEAAHIGQLLYGISQQEFQDYEVIVVDSGSTDSTVKIARSYGARILNIPKSEFSFGRSLNMGCAAAQGELLVVVSGHVYPSYKTWLGKLIEPFADPNVAVSFGKQRGDHRTKFSEHVLFGHWFPDVKAGPQSTYFCNNANCAVRKADWSSSHYDEQLTGLEDLKFAKGLFERGRKVFYASDATVIHVHEESWRQIRRRYMREALAMKAIDPSMKLSFSRFLLLLARHCLGDLQLAAQKKRLVKEFWDILSFRFNQLWGTFLGYHRHGEVTEEMRRRFYYPSKSSAISDESADENHVIDYMHQTRSFEQRG